MRKLIAISAVLIILTVFVSAASATFCIGPKCHPPLVPTPPCTYTPPATGTFGDIAISGDARAVDSSFAGTGAAVATGTKSYAVSGDSESLGTKSYTLSGDAIANGASTALTGEAIALPHTTNAVALSGDAKADGTATAQSGPAIVSPTPIPGT